MVKLEPEMEFELYDVMEHVNIYGRDLENKLEKLIAELLKDHGVYNPENMGGIVIPAGALHWECESGSKHEIVYCHYLADFEVFDKSGDVIIARGTVYGMAVPVDENTLEIINMFVKLYIDNIEMYRKLLSGGRLQAVLQ